MHSVCEWCLLPLGIRDAPAEETAIERAVCDCLCNACGEIRRSLRRTPQSTEYWDTVQWEYLTDLDNCKRELGESNGENQGSNGTPEG